MACRAMVEVGYLKQELSEAERKGQLGECACKRIARTVSDLEKHVCCADMDRQPKTSEEAT